MRQSSVTVRVQAREVVHPAFAGVGFQVEPAVFDAPADERDQVIDKRWRELDPSFVRIDAPWEADPARRDALAEVLGRLQRTGARIALAWSGAPSDPRRLAADLEFLVRRKGIVGLRWVGAGDPPPRALADELQRRRLNLGWILPMDTMSLADGAARSVGRRSLNEWNPEDEAFYPAFLKEISSLVRRARERKQDLWLDALSGKAEGRTAEGVRRDGCVYFGTPLEPLVGLQLAEATLAAIQAGAGAVGYTTFADLPDEKTPGVQRRWGLFRRSGSDRSARAPYYACGLLTRAFRGPVETLEVTTGDPRLRAAAARSAAGDWSIAVVSRSAQAVPLRIEIDGFPLTARMRKYVYDPARVPLHPFGDLPEPVDRLPIAAGKLVDTVGARTLTVYAWVEESAPEPPERLEAIGDAGRVRLTWRPGRSHEVAYYRLYRGVGPDFVPGLATQIGSTVATEFKDDAPVSGASFYRVVAVDRRGNVSSPASSWRPARVTPLPRPAAP